MNKIEKIYKKMIFSKCLTNIFDEITTELIIENIMAKKILELGNEIFEPLSVICF